MEIAAHINLNKWTLKSYSEFCVTILNITTTKNNVLKQNYSSKRKPEYREALQKQTIIFEFNLCVNKSHFISIYVFEQNIKSNIAQFSFLKPLNRFRLQRSYRRREGLSFDEFIRRDFVGFVISQPRFSSIEMNRHLKSVLSPLDNKCTPVNIQTLALNFIMTFLSLRKYFFPSLHKVKWIEIFILCSMLKKCLVPCLLPRNQKQH